MKRWDYARLAVAMGGVFYGVYIITLEGESNLLGVAIIILGLAAAVLTMRRSL